MKQYNNEILVRFCQNIITFSFYLLFFLVPLVLTPLNYELFEFNKMLLVYFLTITIAASWLVKSILQGKFQLARTPLDIPIFLFLTFNFLSFIFSIDRHISIWGYYGRFHGGLLSTISYIILYYAFVSHWSYESHKTHKFLLISLLSGFLVSLYAILQKLGIDKNLWVQDVVSRPFSTLGQPNWLAAYLAILTPIAIAFSLKLKDSKIQRFKTSPKFKGQKKNKTKFLNFESLDFELPLSLWILNFGLLILPLIFYLTLLFTGSRSGFLAVWLVNGAFWLFVYKSYRSHFLRSFLIFNFSFLILTFLLGSPFPQINRFFSLTSRTSRTNLIRPSLPAPIEVTESGDIRRIVWHGAIKAIKAKPLFGWGVETFAWTYYKFKPAEHNLTSEWDFLYNKAHNEYLNFAATTGLFGLGSYLLVITAFICWFLKKLKDSKIQRLKTSSKFQVQWILNFGFFSGWLSILVTNFFGFSVVPVALYFWLIPAMTFSLTTTKETDFSKIVLSSKSSPKIIKIFITVIIFIIFIKFISYLPKLWLADYHFAKAHKLNRASLYQQAHQEITKAINLNADEPLYHDELSIIAASLTLVLYAETPQSPQIPQLTQEAISSSNFSIKKSPHNLNFFKTRTRVFHTLSQLNPDYLFRALEAILTAQQLAPTDAKVSYNLALLYSAADQNDKAIETLKKTLELKSNYQEAQEALDLFLK